jgi:Ice-binding-like
MSQAHSGILAGQSAVLVTMSLLGMLRCNSILGIDAARCTGCVGGGEGVGETVVGEALPGTNAAGPYDPGLATVKSDAGLGTPATEGSSPRASEAAGESTPPAGESTPPAKETAPASDDGNSPSAGEDTPPAGEDTPPAGGNTPPAGGNTPPAGGNTPPTGGNTPPAGGNTPPAGEGTPPPSPEPALAEIVAASALGAASSFAVLAASTTTCTNASAITGDVGVSPGIAVTGFNPSCTLSGALHAGDVLAAAGHAAVSNAFGSIAVLACEHNLTGQDLGGQTLAPGVYCFDASAALTGRLTLDGGGRSSAAWAFQIGSTLITAANSSVVMAGGANACDVFWNVGSSATLGTGTAFKGNVIATANITLVAGSSVVGRVLAVNAAVTSDANQVGGCSN